MQSYISMSARLFTSSILRSARPRILHASPPRRTFFGKPKSPPAAINEADLAKTNEMVKNMLMDKPDAVNALLKFTQALEDAGVPISAGQMPGPMQMLKLAGNKKFVAAATELQAELSKAGIDIRSKEFMDQMMTIVKQMPRGS
ncbi:hypothetical protein FB45DRAFT_406913 [Roridomyces roridus]|uniref:Uncharacterized protein n=1 Tax=Roridomyces roridus TaxID=1738132 RepID=A0AAD7C4C4_9AGAR|nr:hypothetical protein FB45DRAFT_406913 [Roridomyces roridus]